jgi:hypothetical protein
VQKEFIYLLIVLAFVAGSLFVTFIFLATMQASEGVALLLFLAVAGLMIVGYMAGVLVLAIAALAALTKYVGLLNRQQPKHPTKG